MGNDRLIAVSFAYPPAMYAMSILVWRLLRYSGRRFCVVSGDEGRPPDPGLSESACDGADEVRAIPFRESSIHLLARRALSGSSLVQLLEIPDIYRSWVSGATRRVLALEPGKGDVLVTFASPMSDHLVGVAVKRKRPDLPWVAYFGDPWVRNPMIRRSRAALALSVRLERSVVRAADLLIFPCEEMRDITLGGYGPAVKEKARVVAHGFEEKLFRGEHTPYAGRPYKVRHLGSLYGSRSPTDLITALGLLLQADPALPEKIRFEFFGVFPDGTEHLIESLPAGLITFHPPVPYLESLRLMRSADALLVISPSEADSGAFLPSKLIDYMGAGRPILGICRPGACRSLLDRLGGWVSDIGESILLAENIRSLTALLDSGEGSPVPWGEASVRDSYSAERTGRIFSGFVGELL